MTSKVAITSNQELPDDYEVKSVVLHEQQKPHPHRPRSAQFGDFRRGGDGIRYRFSIAIVST